MDFFVTHAGGCIAQSKNATAIPRKGDVLMILEKSFTVINVVWHMDSRIWVEIQVRYGA